MDRDQKRDMMSKVQLRWMEILSYVKEGDRESAERVISNLIERNAFESKEVYGCLLVIAANRGEIEAAEFCKDKGADLDYEDYNERAPLWIAKRFKQDKMAEALKGWGARKDTHDRFGQPSPHSGILTDVLKEENFIDSNQEKQSVHIARKMPLYWKEIFSDIKKDDRESAERKAENLIERNKWEPKEVYGYLLVIAANYGEIEVAEFCKDKGADLDYEDYKGRTPLGTAKHFKQDRMAEALKKWGAREDAHYKWGRPSSSLESPSCSGQEKQKGHAKKTSCNLM